MSRVLYAKYNHLRAPQFQTVTEIVAHDDILVAQKRALSEKALSHINSFINKFHLCKTVFKNAKPCNVVINDNIACFDYLEGITVGCIIENSKDIDEFISKTKKYINIVFVYNDKSIVPFEYTDAFKNIFGNPLGLNGEKAIVGLNVDPIFDNFIYCGNELFIIDYEWCFDFPVPVDFALYRALFYLYAKNSVLFSRKLELDDFLCRFDIDSEKQRIFKEMDLKFQQYIHGENWKYMYTRNYMKKICHIKDMLSECDDVQSELDNRQRTISELNELTQNLTEQLRLVDNHAKNLEAQVSILESVNKEYENNINILNSRIFNIEAFKRRIGGKDNI